MAGLAAARLRPTLPVAVRPAATRSLGPPEDELGCAALTRATRLAAVAALA